MDTAVVLQIRDAFELIEADMNRLRATLADGAALSGYANGRSHPFTAGATGDVWL